MIQDNECKLNSQRLSSIYVFQENAELEGATEAANTLTQSNL